MTGRARGSVVHTSDAAADSSLNARLSGDKLGANVDVKNVTDDDPISRQSRSLQCSVHTPVIAGDVSP